jgi:hypothetical protein
MFILNTGPEKLNRHWEYHVFLGKCVNFEYNTGKDQKSLGITRFLRNNPVFPRTKWSQGFLALEQRMGNSKLQIFIEYFVNFKYSTVKLKSHKQ